MEAKESWFDIQCIEIEQAKEKVTISKEGTAIVEKHKVLERLIEYI